MNPIQVLGNGDEPIVVGVNFTEYFQEKALLEAPQVQELEGVPQQHHKLFGVQGFLGAVVVLLVSAQAQLGDEVEEHFGKGNELNGASVKLEEPIHQEGEFDLAEVSKESLDESS